MGKNSMEERGNLLLVALVAIIAIGALSYAGSATGALGIGNRHSCGGNIIGLDVESYHLGSPDCFVCPGNPINTQPHVMCKYTPLKSSPPGGPRGLYS